MNIRPESRARRKTRTARRQRRGAVIVLAGLLMIAIAAMAAFAIDCGRIALAREQLQVAADAGALAGADTLVNGPTAAVNTAQTFAQENGVAGAQVIINAAQDIQVGKWDAKALTFTALTGSAQANANAVRVTCTLSQSRGNPLRLFFAPVLGKTSIDLSAQSVALGASAICGPFIGVNSLTMSGGCYTDSYDSSQGGYSRSSAGAKGTVCSNASISLSGGTTINGNAHPGVGQTVDTSGAASVTGSTNALTQPLTEPPVDPGSAATVNNNGNIPLSSKGKSPLDSQGQFSLSGGDSVVLPPGTYYFSSIDVSGGASVIMTGQTIIYCAGNIDFSGGTAVNSTQSPANCQIYGLSTCSSVKLSGSADLYGVIYAPSADISRSGGSDVYGMLVGASLTFTGGGGCHYDQSIGSLVGAQQRAQLVQ